jgi:hypothetical protein
MQRRKGIDACHRHPSSVKVEEGVYIQDGVSCGARPSERKCEAANLAMVASSGQSPREPVRLSLPNLALVLSSRAGTIEDEAGFMISVAGKKKKSDEAVKRLLPLETDFPNALVVGTTASICADEAKAEDGRTRQVTVESPLESAVFDDAVLLFGFLACCRSSFLLPAPRWEIPIRSGRGFC